MRQFGDLDRRQHERQTVHISARVKSGLRVALDSSTGDGEIINGVVITDLSGTGLGTSDTIGLSVGMAVMVEVPLVGWREAVVVWLRDGHAGCHFSVPLSAAELNRATLASPLICEGFPGLRNAFNAADAPEAGPSVPALVGEVLEPWEEEEDDLAEAVAMEFSLALRVVHRHGRIISVSEASPPAVVG